MYTSHLINFFYDEELSTFLRIYYYKNLFKDGADSYIKDYLYRVKVEKY